MSLLLHVLLISDKAEDHLALFDTLSQAGYEPVLQQIGSEEELRAALSSGSWDAILCEYNLPCLSCEKALEVLKSTGSDVPLITLSGSVDEQTVLALLRAGARDYVLKDNLARLPSSIQRELREREDRRQRNRLEAQLQQAMKMEAIGRLAAGVAHDFNNLLTVITGFAQLALLDPNPAREGLQEIMRAAERAAALTRQLLAFSRQQALETRVFDLNQLVADLDKMLRRLIGEDVEVITRIVGEPLMVKADPGKLEQVILNLAVNSRDAMPVGGKLILSTSRRVLEGGAADMHGLPDNDYCVVSISDNGAGIAPETLPHIFEPFFTTKPEGRGTGLGLSTAYGIVQQSGGAIHAYSEKNVGTTMTVFIPASSVGTDKSIYTAAEPLPTGNETILIAEDDARVLQLVCHCLTVRGFTVLEARDGEQALDILSQRGPHGVDLMITDVVMPRMTGAVLAERAAALVPDLRILFMSGYTEEVIQLHGISAGSTAFLQKPFAPRELVRKVRHLLDVGKAEGGVSLSPTQPRL